MEPVLSALLYKSIFHFICGPGLYFRLNRDALTCEYRIIDPVSSENLTPYNYGSGIFIYKNNGFLQKQKQSSQIYLHIYNCDYQNLLFNNPEGLASGEGALPSFY